MKKIIISCAVFYSMMIVSQEVMITFPSTVELKRKLHEKKFNNRIVTKLAEDLGSKYMALRGVAFAITAVCEPEESTQALDLANVIDNVVDKDLAYIRLQQLLED